MIDIIHLIKDLVKERNLQKFINNRFYDTNKHEFVFDNRIFTKIGAYDGNIFYTNEDMIELNSAYIDYDISNIDKNTNVLVIGANVGGFSLRAAKKAKHVYAVEPVMTEQLKKNIALNNINNITVIDCGIGKSLEFSWGGLRNKLQAKIFSWNGHEKITKICTIQEILKMCNDNINYLKMDCEGCEYSICKEDLNGIQEIVAELHNINGTTPFNIFTDLLKKNGFTVEVKSKTKQLMLIHAIRKTS